MKTLFAFLLLISANSAFAGKEETFLASKDWVLTCAKFREVTIIRGNLGLGDEYYSHSPLQISFHQSGDGNKLYANVKNIMEASYWDSSNTASKSVTRDFEAKVKAPSRNIFPSDKNNRTLSVGSGSTNLEINLYSFSTTMAKIEPDNHLVRYLGPLWLVDAGGPNRLVGSCVLE